MTLPMSFLLLGAGGRDDFDDEGFHFAGSRPLGRYFFQDGDFGVVGGDEVGAAAFSNSARASARFFTALRRVVMTMASSIGLPESHGRALDGCVGGAEAERGGAVAAFSEVTISARRVS